MLSKFTFVRKIFLFGSTLSGRITGASDIDLLVIINNIDPKEAHLKMTLALEDELGEEAYIIDIHVVSENMLSEQPFKWFLKKAVKIYDSTK